MPLSTVGKIRAENKFSLFSVQQTPFFCCAHSSEMWLRVWMWMCPQWSVKLASWSIRPLNVESSRWWHVFLPMFECTCATHNAHVTQSKRVRQKKAERERSDNFIKNYFIICASQYFCAAKSLSLLAEPIWKWWAPQTTGLKCWCEFHLKMNKITIFVIAMANAVNVR